MEKASCPVLFLFSKYKKVDRGERRWNRYTEFSASLCFWKFGAKEGFILLFVNNHDRYLQNSHEKERGEFFVK